MYILTYFAVVLLVAFALCPDVAAAPRTEKTEPALLVVSYDAFRPEYFDRGVTPNLNKFRAEGTSAKFLSNVFPTKTFVNHHTIATGFYPETHGVTMNKLYDSKLGPLGYSYDLFHYNETIKPIWVANQLAGKYSGCMMWPGNDFEYTGINCTFSLTFNAKEPWIKRVDTALSWFTHPKTPANLVMLYIEEPDAMAHVFGPESDVITNVVAKLDNLTQYIQQKLIDLQLSKRVNVIHLSDHGMNSVSPPNFIDLTKFVENNTCDFYGSTPVLQIVPRDKKWENAIYANLTRAAQLNGHFKVYNHENVPQRWNVNNQQRMGPIFAVADIKYAFQDMFKTAELYRKKFNISITPTTKYGAHGYDNADESMHAIFMAKGPSFPAGATIPSLKSVDLYNLFCALLNIRCDANDGTTHKDAFNTIIRNPINRLPSRYQQIVSMTESEYDYFTNTHDSRRILSFAKISLPFVALFLFAFGIFYGVFRVYRKIKADKNLVAMAVDEEELLLSSDESIM